MIEDTGQVVLQATGLKKAYGNIQAVDGLSFSVLKGEIFGFLGPNGAGKTTTIRMMCGLIQPDEGRVEINGRDTLKRDRQDFGVIGFCPQHIVIWEGLTCNEQLEFMGRMYGLERKMAIKRSRELLETFGLTEKWNKLAKTLSGGMQRRLNIALALVHEPEILFLDEPQAGLDPQSRVLVRDYIRHLAKKMTVILTTHDMEEAEKLSDRVCIIDKGKLLVMDTVANIKNQLGEGDLFEIEILEDVKADLMPFFTFEQNKDHQFVAQNHTLTMVSAKAVEILPQILQVIESRHLQLQNLRIRQKTLEDVFIRLTGRGLRE